MTTQTQQELREWRLILELTDISVPENQESEEAEIATGRTADSDEQMESWTPEKLGLDIWEHFASNYYCPSDLNEDHSHLMLILKVKVTDSYWRYVTSFYPKKFTCGKCGEEYYVLVSLNQDHDANFVPPPATSESPLVIGEFLQQHGDFPVCHCEQDAN